MSPIAKYVLFAFLSSWLLLPAALHAQHPAWHQYTTSDGLPSNEIYGMLQDSRGFLWFSTDLGLCRFNGYEFHRPVDTSSYASNATFRLAEDLQGRVWFNRLDASIWLVENDTVRRWKHNHIIEQYRGKFVDFGGLAVDKGGAVWEHLVKLGILVVQPDGQHQVLPSTGHNAIVFADVDGKAIMGQEVGDKPDPFAAKNLTSEVFHWQQGHTVSLGRFSMDRAQAKKLNATGVWRLRGGDFIFNYLQTFYLLRDNHVVWSGVKDVAAHDIHEDTDGSLLLSSRGGANRGLLRFRSLAHFQRDEFVNILPGHNAAYSLRDHEGGWWAATTNEGVLYCKNPDLNILDTANGLSSNDVLSLSSDAEETIYAALRPMSVCVIQRREGRAVPLPPSTNFVIANESVLRFDPLAKRLWASPYLCFWEKNQWHSVSYEKQGDRFPYAAKRITPSRSNSLWWASSSNDFFSIDPATGTVVMYFADSSKYRRTHSVAQDFEGNIWVATEGGGLGLWRNNHRYEAPPFDHPALRYPARIVEVMPDSSLVISLRGGGLLFRRKNGQFDHLTTQDGLTSNWLSDLDITPEGIIYASSNAGLNILRPLPSVTNDEMTNDDRPQPSGGWRIETLTTKHGLPSNQVNDVTWLGDEIWVATDRGIARFRGKPAPAPMPVPMLEKFTVNNRDTICAPNLRLAYRQNNIALRFFALHFRSGGDIAYRYRLLPADTAFTYAHNRVANFSLLPPGRYVFEAQAQNEDGKWSEASHWPFEIRPPWWATLWFRSLVAAALAAAAYLFFQNRLRAIRREAAEREKIRDLEAAALRAQMNPHFIFNCLQAIQSFIAKNDGDTAATYLARFARLVRLALHGSVDGRHTLTEEMAMLENYLHLEQLRFQGKFEFVVRAAPGLDANEVSLPPLLVQPLVENALIHGMKNRESGGRVEVVFSQKGQMLEASVTDNGPGFSEKEDSEKGPHRSVGMMLTQKRLDLLARAAKTRAEHFARETVFDENGLATGARVRIVISVMVE